MNFIDVTHHKFMRVNHYHFFFRCMFLEINWNVQEIKQVEVILWISCNAVWPICSYIHYISPENAIDFNQFEYLAWTTDWCTSMFVVFKIWLLNFYMDFFQFDPCGSTSLHVDDQKYYNQAKTISAGMMAKNKGHTISWKRASNSFSIKTQLPCTYTCTRINL